MSNAEPLEKSHLQFYRQHQIAPVSYDLRNMEAHLERRESLYLQLKLPPFVFRSKWVLEIAAGLGHNSLYLAQNLPEKLVLLEPNAIGVEQIRLVYSQFTKPHTPPEIISCMLENYFPDSLFDIVLCENWLGTSQHERSLLDKISRMVTHHGVLVITTVSPIGFVPNLLRRFLSMYWAPVHESFEKRTCSLVELFAPHLNTLQSMTRNHVDWVQDNMINPAYFGLCLSIPQVLMQLQSRFEILGTSPSIAEDWRWFKGLWGPNRQFNEQFLLEYWRKAHNFLDCREPITVRDSVFNIKLENQALALLKAIEMHEEALICSQNPSEHVRAVQDHLERFISYVPTHFSAALSALNEVHHLIKWISIGEPISKSMPHFQGLFGRETVYISLLAKGGV